MIEFEDVKYSRKRKVCIGTNANRREYQFQIRYKETTINGKRYNGSVSVCGIVSYDTYNMIRDYAIQKKYIKEIGE